MVGIGAVRALAHAHGAQHLRGVAADHALPGIGGFAFAVELDEGAQKGGVLFGAGAVKALEGGFRLAGHVGAAGGQLRIHRIAEVLGAAPAV